MTENLSTNLHTKIPLSFSKEGKFRILCISDIQETTDFFFKTKLAIELILDAAKPDLVLLIGDSINGVKIKTEREVREYVKILEKFFNDRKLPWAHVWGNHDHDVGIDEDVHESIYSESPYCLSRSAKGVSGQSNFVLPIYSHDKSKVVFNVWGLDSGGMMPEYFEKVAGKKGEDYWDEAKDMKKKFKFLSIFGQLNFDRLIWYYNSSREFEEYCGKKVDSLMVTHVAPWEIANVVDNPAECGTTGTTYEGYGCSTINSGLFSAVMERNDVRAICVGHTHCNDLCGKYLGVILANDGTVSYSAYGDNNTRGGRVFDISEDNPSEIETFMIHTTDMLFMNQPK